MANLFQGHPDLIEEFRVYLPNNIATNGAHPATVRSLPLVHTQPSGQMPGQPRTGVHAGITGGTGQSATVQQVGPASQPATSSPAQVQQPHGGRQPLAEMVVSQPTTTVVSMAPVAGAPTAGVGTL